MIIETNPLRRQILEWGADLVGIGDIAGDEENAALPDELKHFTRAISIAIHCKSHLNSSPGGSENDDHQRMIDYLKENENVVKKLTDILKKTSKRLKINGHRYMELPPVHSVDDRRFISVLYPLFPHRTAATCAGLGWIGKNGMLINGHYGPNLVWATILTNADLVASRPQLLGMCDRCRLCVTACPVDAIKGINWNRARGNEEIIEIATCEDYMNTNEEKFGRPVCGICFMACPIGARITRPVLKP